MNLLLSFIVQLAGCYILYSTSSRAVFARRKHHIYLHKHRRIYKVLGGLLLLVSGFLFMNNIGISTGILFALTSLMAVSGCLIILFPLLKK